MNASICRHLKTNGTLCKSRALAKASYCRTHEHLHEGRMSLRANDSTGDVHPTSTIKLEPVEESASVQRALSVVITAVAAGTLDAARARVLLYGLQIASANTRRLVTAPKAEVLAPKAESSGDSTVEVKEQEIDPGNAEIDAVQAVKADPEIKQFDPGEAMSTECNDADFAEETSLPATAHVPDNPVHAASSFGYPTYEMEARSRMLAIKRLRDERANSLLTQHERVTAIFGDE